MSQFPGDVNSAHPGFLPAEVISTYRRRMQIEQGFLDLKIAPGV